MPVYLDCAATTPLEPRVRGVMLQHMGDEFANAGSRTHVFGNNARRAVEKARQQIAAVAGAGRGEVIFTSGATEANNLAILGLAEHGLLTGRKHIVSTMIEHNAVLEPLEALRRRGFEITLLPPKEKGWVEPQVVQEALRPDTLLVSVMQVNNETGVIQPVPEIAAAMAGHDAYFHVDAAQGFGRELQGLQNPRLDLISISAHKIHGPQGIGALITRRRGDKRPPIAPIAFGGGQELGLRPGTLPVAFIAGFGAAAELAMAEAETRAATCRAFRERLLAALEPLNPTFNGNPARTVPHILNLSIPGLTSDEVIEAIADLVAISNGSACTSQSETCSHVLGAMRLSSSRAEGATRWSWSHLTPEPDWVAIVERIRLAIASSGQ